MSPLAPHAYSLTVRQGPLEMIFIKELLISSQETFQSGPFCISIDSLIRTLPLNLPRASVYISSPLYMCGLETI